MGNMPFQGKVVKLHKAPKALVIKPSSLGDIIHSLPFLNAFRKRYPDSTVHWAVFKGLEGILKGHPMIDRLVVIDKGRFRNPLNVVKSVLALRAELRSEAFDIAVDLQGLLRSGVMAAMSSAPVRAGFSDAREGSPFFYTNVIEGGKDIHAVDRYLRIAAMLDCDTSTIEFPMVHDDCKPPFDGDYAVIVPGARWATKQWPAEYFGSLASILPVRSVVVGSNGDMRAGDTVVSRSDGKAVNMAGKTTLRELSGLIMKARYVITNDTGPMHIAAAYNVPVIAIFGPTNPVNTGPYGSIHKILTPDIPCAPCYRRNCSDLRCMTLISPERVYQSVLSL